MAEVRELESSQQKPTVMVGSEGNAWDDEYAIDRREGFIGVTSEPSTTGDITVTLTEEGD